MVVGSRFRLPCCKRRSRAAPTTKLFGLLADGNVGSIVEWPFGPASASEAARRRVLRACACPRAPPSFGRGHRVLRSERQPARSTGAPAPWSLSPVIGFLGGVLAAALLRMACLPVTSWVDMAWLVVRYRRAQREVSLSLELCRRIRAASLNLNAFST